MVNILLSGLVAVSVGTWLYTKFMRRSGNNTQTSLLVAGLLAVIIFFVVWSLAAMIDSALG